MRLAYDLVTLLDERPVWAQEVLVARLKEMAVAPRPGEPGVTGGPGAGTGAQGPGQGNGGAAAAASSTPGGAQAGPTSGGVAGAQPPSGSGGGAGVLAATGDATRAPQLPANIVGTAFSSQAVQANLVRHVYRFRTGPWRGLCVRRGYDPRQDPEARRYQVLQYKLPTGWFNTMAAHRALTGGGQGAGQGKKAGAGAKVQGPAGAGQGSGAGPFARAPSLSPAPAGASPFFCYLERLHHFLDLPSSSSVELQVCDLQDDRIRRLLANSKPTDR